jgi:hypothetical protein
VDKLRQTVGRTDALRILRLAGYDAERLAGNWDEQERPVQHQSSKDLSMYSEDPTYDPTYLDLACRLGPGHPEAVARLAAVRAEQEEARLSGEGRLSVRETMARQMVDQQREAEAHEQRMRDAGWRRGAHGTWVRDRPIFEHDTAGSV